jgi:hypothetical protein
LIGCGQLSCPLRDSKWKQTAKISSFSPNPVEAAVSERKSFFRGKALASSRWTY